MIIILMSVPQTRAKLIMAIRLKNLPNDFTIPGSQIPLTSKKQLKYLTKPILESIYASTKRSNISDKFHRRSKLYIANLNKNNIIQTNIKRKLKLQHAQTELHSHLVVLHQILKRAHRGDTIRLKELYDQLPSSGYFSVLNSSEYYRLYLIATGTTPDANYNYMFKVSSLINKIQKLKAKIHRIKHMK